MSDWKHDLEERRTRLPSVKRAILDALIDHGAGPGKSAFPSSLPRVVAAPEERHLPFPLTDVQQAYWVGRSGAVELGQVAAHSYQEIDWPDLDVERMEQALQRLIERHEMLRAIVREDGQQQILAQVPPYRIAVLDLRGKNSATTVANLDRVRKEMSHQILRSDQWPLFDIRASLLDERRVRIHISLDMLIADAWSIEILTRELAQLYYDPATPLTPLTLSFRDYVLAHLRLRDTQFYQRALEYWNSRLASLPHAPALPLATHLSFSGEDHFKRRSAGLEPAAWRRFKALASAKGLTCSAALLAAFAAVLARWSKNPDFTINLTLFQRLPLHPQVDDIVGDFTSLTLLEVHVAPGHAFATVGERVQAHLWQDLEHQYVSGVHVLRELTRQLGGPPSSLMPVVFTSTLTLLEEDSSVSLGRCEAGSIMRRGTSVYGITQTPQVWLDHQVKESGGRLMFSWDAVEGLFPPGMLDDMFAAYCQVLQRLAEDEEAWQGTSSQLVPIPAAQRAQRAAVNATRAAVSLELLHTLFAKQVEQGPDQRAVVAAGRTLSYAELYGWSNRIAGWLRQWGAGRNRLVAVVMEKGWEQVAGVLGVLQAGAAYLPIDAQLPAERMAYLLRQGEVELALTQSWVEGRVSWPAGIRRLQVDVEVPEAEDGGVGPLQRPEDLAYVIYTSGSTGQPKGVMIDHRGAVNTLLDINRRFGVGSQDRMLALSELSFDLSVYDIFGVLAAGGTIVLPEAGASRDPSRWMELLRGERVTLWNSVPALAEMLVDHLAGCGQSPLTALRLVLLSGDWIPVSLPERFKAVAPEAQLISLGGATEASIWSIFYRIGEVDPAWHSIPYGRTLANQSVQVLDEALVARPVWVPGQLYIGGVGLAQGYWRDGERTEASFPRHPQTGERLYRTGDLGRYLPDGNIEFLGRQDTQVKIRGHRIELGEIEAALAQHPAVRAGVVTVAGEEVASKRLVAYVVADWSAFAAGPELELASQQAGGNATVGEDEELISDPVQRLQFKLGQPGLRRDEAGEWVQLVRPALDEDLIKQYVARRSYRQFGRRVIPFAAFSQLLSCLRQLDLAGNPLPKLRYGSAGSLYPVQTYVYVRAGAVEGVEAGSYYYDRQDHRLVRLSAEVWLEERGVSGDHQNLFRTAAFALFLVAQLDAIRPLYGEWSRDLCLLEAGLMTQLLEMNAPSQQIGLCQVGELDFGPLRQWFDLCADHLYLHALVGGPIEDGQSTLAAYEQETAELRLLTSRLGTGGPGSSREATLSAELRSFVQKKLPEYMVPSCFVLLDTLPLTANGKVDRGALPEPESLPRDREPSFVSPTSDVERAIAAIWKDILQLNQISIHDNFFDVGGDSVQLIRVHTRLSEMLSSDIPIIRLFEHPTIYSLAADITDQRSKCFSLESTRDWAEARNTARAKWRHNRQ
jgi:epothilone synthetase B